jgi:outer membrane translocation and assembly module TamA
MTTPPRDQTIPPTNPASPGELDRTEKRVRKLTVEVARIRDAYNDMVKAKDPSAKTFYAEVYQPKRTQLKTAEVALEDLQEEKEQREREEEAAREAAREAEEARQRARRETEERERAQAAQRAKAEAAAKQRAKDEEVARMRSQAGPALQGMIARAQHAAENAEHATHREFYRMELANLEGWLNLGDIARGQAKTEASGDRSSKKTKSSGIVESDEDEVQVVNAPVCCLLKYRLTFY